MLRFIDSCDHYVTGDLTEKYHNSGGVTVQVGAGRRGTSGISFAGSQAWCGVTFEPQDRWIIGFALLFAGVINVVGSPSIVDLANNGTRQFNVRITPEGFVQVARGSTLLGVSTQALHENIYYYMELMVHIADAGEVIVRVDGVTWVQLTGVDTQETADILPTQVRFGPTGVSGYMLCRMDDIYICDGQGSGTFTTFLGDCRVDALFPNADGTYTAWTPSSGTSHYPTVDETPPNNDIDYVSTTTGGARDSYHLEPLPTMPNPTVLAVQACLNVRKEDVDEILISPLLVSNGVTSLGTGIHETNAAYKYALDLWTVDPGTGAGWTTAAVNALEVGVERLA